MGVVGDSLCQRHDKGSVIVHGKLAAGGRTLADDLSGCAEYLFLTAFDHLVGAGVVWVGMFYHIVGIKIIFQISIW